MRNALTLFAAMLAALVAVIGPAQAVPAEATDGYSCAKRYNRTEARQTIYKTHSDLTASAKDKRKVQKVTYCQKRTVSKRLVRRYLYSIKREIRSYKTNLLPWCTWGPESGAHRQPFDPDRYTETNPASSAAGKYQFLDSTWLGLGGVKYSDYHIAASAPPIEQEDMAHDYYAMSGGSPWVNC